MNKSMRVLLPVAAALSVMIAVPYLSHSGECSCRNPVLLFGSIFGCGESKQQEALVTSVKADQYGSIGDNTPDKSIGKTELKVTFVEIGSVNCIPCKMMQPIMRAVEEEYKGQVKVVFYDVWTPEGRPFGEIYRIRVIPTQVFLDRDGREYYRHEGFFPKEELVKVLKMRGVQ